MTHVRWIITLPDLPKVDTDQLTLEDATRFEDASGTAWTEINPARRARDAAGLALALALRAGMTEQQAETYVKGLTYESLRGAFTIDVVVDGINSDGEPLPPHRAPSSTAG